MKELRLQNKLRTQNFHKSLKKFFEPGIDKVQQTAQEMNGAVKDTAKAIELKREQANEAFNKIEDL